LADASRNHEITVNELIYFGTGPSMEECALTRESLCGLVRNGATGGVCVDRDEL